MNRHDEGHYDEAQLNRMRWIASLWFVGHVGMAAVAAWESWAPSWPAVWQLALAMTPL